MYDQCDVREAVHEFQEYLSDRLPPLMVLDSVGLLLQAPAALMANEIGAWASHQRASASESDLLYHCVKKVCALGDLELVQRGMLARYLRELSEAVLPYCPEDEREELRHSLSQLGNGIVPLVPTPAQIIHRQHPDDPQATSAVHAALGASAGATSGAGATRGRARRWERARPRGRARPRVRAPRRQQERRRGRAQRWVGARRRGQERRRAGPALRPAPWRTRPAPP